MDVWLKDIAPSPGLRGGSVTTRPSGRSSRSATGPRLEANPDAVTDLRRRIREGPVTFVYAARDEQHNGALALKEYLRRHPS